jgi:hypothetical protein
VLRTERGWVTAVIGPPQRRVFLEFRNPPQRRRVSAARW